MPYNTITVAKVKMTIIRTTLTALLASSFVMPAMADEKEELLKLKNAIANERQELLKLKNTTINLIDVFVQEGILDKNKAQKLVKAAESKAADEASKQIAQEAANDKADASKAEETAVKSGKSSKTVHVAYVPEFVKEEIRQQVRAELKDDVIKDVKADAKAEKWGVPGALPEWVNNIRISGDLRLRAVEDFFGADNSLANNQFYDYLSINKEGGHLDAFNKNEEFLNTTKDRVRLRERLRLAVDAQVTDNLKAGIRLATTNNGGPVSNNQTLGNTDQSWAFVIDRAFLQYDFVDQKGNDWFSLYGGRIANPWVSTDVVFDRDLSFEGFSGTFRAHFNQDDPTVKAYRAPSPTARLGINTGPQTPNSVFATVGVFPIQEVNFSTTDKWMFGGQVGADWLVHDDSRLKVATAYYDYENINARPNANNSFTNDWTAPQYIQKGNSIVPINVNDGFNTRCTNSQSVFGQGCLYGLASDFKIFNATAIYDFAGFEAAHVMLTADYAKNLGYSASRIAREFGGLDNYSDNKAKTTAFQVRLDVGRPETIRLNDWNTFFAYRYVERDAVLDAFTDAVFHGGGTNAKGWVIGGNYGLAKNTWLNFRWFSTDNIDGPPLIIDTAVLDLSTRF